MVANTARDPKKHRKAFQPSDFMPDDEAEEKKPLAWEDLKAKSMSIFRSLGGKVKT